MKKCWTEPSFSHHGEFFSVPPTYTKWNHRQTIAYFQSDKAERRLEDVLALGAARHVFGRQPGAGDDHDPEGAAGLSAAGAEAAPADLGAADQRPLAQIRGRARDQRRHHRRAERPPAPQYRDLLRGGGKGRLSRHAQPGTVQIRLGRRETARHHDQPLSPHHPPGQEKAGARPRRAGDRIAVRLLRAVRLRCGRGPA